MCLVIDTCCLAMVFQGDNRRHREFVPVLRWIHGRGCMIYGGTKYNRELRAITDILGLVIELSKQRRTVQIPTATVDTIAAALKARFPERAFNDEHIVALVIASRCRVVCTDDTGAISYLRRTDVFQPYPNVKRPSIYRGARNGRLCCDRYITDICPKAR
jgi:hypothetical protein